MINKYFAFRGSCAARNINFLLLKIGLSIERPIAVATAGAIDQPNSICEIFSDEDENFPPCNRITPDMCITVTDSESGDGEVDDGSHYAGTHTGKRSAEAEYFPSSYRQGINRSSICKYTFSRLHSLKWRMSKGATSVGCKNTNNCISNNKRSQADYPIKCGWLNCKNVFECEDDAMYHKAQYHASGLNKTFECNLCKMSFVNIRSLKTHMNLKHIHRRKFKCPFSDCRGFFNHNDSLRYHIAVHHSTEELSSAGNKEIANSRLDDRRNDDKFPNHCVWPGCKQVFESKSAQLYHLTVFHRLSAKKIFQCHLCKTTLMDIRSLKQHMSKLHVRRTSSKCS